MALVKSSERSTAEYLDLKELAGEAVVMTVQEIEESRDFGNGPIEPVIARVIVLTGARAGETHDRERILPAGVRSKLTEVGEDVVGRLAIYGSRKAIGLNNEADGDVDLAIAALAEANGAAKPKAGAKAKPKAAPEKDEDGGGEIDYDDDPPFAHAFADARPKRGRPGRPFADAPMVV